MIEAIALITLFALVTIGQAVFRVSKPAQASTIRKPVITPYMGPVYSANGREIVREDSGIRRI